jgi:lysyl-tRNA synthetase class 1
MFWGDTIIADIQARFGEQIKRGDTLIIRDEKTPSGRVHIGSMRGVAIHGLVQQLLADKGIKAVFKYEFNNLDPMDGLPTYLDESVYKQHMGKPLRNVPSPDNSAANYAEYFANEFKKVITDAGFTPEFYNVSDLYESGKMNDVIRTALERAADIRAIYKKVSGGEKPDDWLPLNVICEQCGKVGTTKVFAFDGENVSYTCQPNGVKWAQGCGHKGTISPFGGNATMPFKVEWAAKFKEQGVQIEGAGKDHSTKGGAHDVANHIAREVFDYEPPLDIPYEFFLVGGKKMSSSKGAGSSAREVKDLLPAHIFRLAFFDKRPLLAINFDPSGDTVPILFDRYDTLADKYATGVQDDETRVFESVHAGTVPPPQYRMRFSLVTFLVQMPHLDIMDEAAKEKGSELTQTERETLDERAHYARFWLRKYAPERYVYKLTTDALPDVVKDFTPLQKNALSEIKKFVESHEQLDGAMLHAELHRIKESLGIAPKELFGAIYRTFLNRDSGPQAGWFLSVLPRELLLGHLERASV